MYTYEGFLQAVGKFPKFCGEKGPNLPNANTYTYTDDEVCKRELAIMFAHFNQETGYNWDHPTVERFR